MIELKDIQTAVAAALRKNGFSVVANEIKEGFSKPACFVSVLPVSIETENQFSELVTDSVEIAYYPAVETNEELIIAAEKIRGIFLYTPLEVNTTLYAKFDMEYLQEVEADAPTLPKNENIKRKRGDRKLWDFQKLELSSKPSPNPLSREVNAAWSP